MAEKEAVYVLDPEQLLLPCAVPGTDLVNRSLGNPPGFGLRPGRSYRLHDLNARAVVLNYLSCWRGWCIRLTSKTCSQGQG